MQIRKGVKPQQKKEKLLINIDNIDYSEKISSKACSEQSFNSGEKSMSKKIKIMEELRSPGLPSRTRPYQIRSNGRSDDHSATRILDF